MANDTRLELSVIEQRVCNVVSAQLGIPRDKVLPSSRLIEDLRCDSLDLVELLMELEDEFLVTIPNEPNNPVGKSVFTRQPFRLGDLAEIVYLQQGSGKPERTSGRQTKLPDFDYATIPFSQLGGYWQMDSSHLTYSLFEPLGSEIGIRQFRRRSDGMRCLQLPAAETRIGSDRSDAQPDEQPVHMIHLDSFLVDAEPVSTTAYCRFLNSVQATESVLLDWFQLNPADDRIAQMPVVLSDNGWRPVVGAETLPMVLVSWFGANAYSLWANGSEWKQYQTQAGFLPSEAQYEYAAQGQTANQLHSTQSIQHSYSASMSEAPFTGPARCRWHPFTIQSGYHRSACITWQETSGNGAKTGLLKTSINVLNHERPIP